MARRIIWIVVAIAVLGVAGYFAYDLTLGERIRRGAALKAAIAERLEKIGIVYTSLEYDWRSNSIIAANLSPTELPKDVTAATIERAIYRGAAPAAYDAILDGGTGSEGPRVTLVDELTLTNLLVAFANGGAVTQPEIKLVNLSMRSIPEPSIPQAENMTAEARAGLARWLRLLDGLRSLHVGLFETSDGRVWMPDGRVEYKQGLFRLEDYRGGDFSELRLEGVSLSAAVVVRLTLDEYFIDSVEAGRLLDSLYKTRFWSANGAKDLIGAVSGLSVPPMAEWYPPQGDAGIIGFELLIPGAGRIAIKESLITDRQFINGNELGGKNKLTGFEMQSGMLATVLTAALDTVSDDAAVQLVRGVDEAIETLTTIPAFEQGEGQSGAKPEGKENKEKESDTPPGSGGQSQGWTNPVKPPEKSKPKWDNKKFGKFVARLGFTNIHIDAASTATFDVDTDVWEWSEFDLRMRDFWDLSLTFRLAGMGAVEDMGLQPMSPPEAVNTAQEAFWKRLVEEGRIENVLFTYQDKGFVKRLMELLAEELETTVEDLAAKTVADLFPDGGASAPVWSEGLDTAIRGFLTEPQGLTIAVKPDEPAPFSLLQNPPAKGESAGALLQRLGFSLTLNGQTFTEFKKNGPVSRDNAADPD